MKKKKTQTSVKRAQKWHLGARPHPRSSLLSLPSASESQSSASWSAASKVGHSRKENSRRQDRRRGCKKFLQRQTHCHLKNLKSVVILWDNFLWPNCKGLKRMSKLKKSSCAYFSFSDKAHTMRKRALLQI